MTRKIVCGLVLLALAACATGKNARPDYLARIDADLRVAAKSFLEGRMTGRAYLDLSTDRAGKARRFHGDAAWREAAARGDRDRDGVPDPYDDCDTPPLEPTDERGCPLDPPDCRPDDPRCGPGPDDDLRTRNLLDEVTLMFNPGCDGSPVPQTPDPLEWGRGPQTPAGTSGFNLAVTEVDNQAPGCEFFYEIQFRFELPAPTHVHYVTVLFKAAEDLKPGDRRRAVFGIPNLPNPGSPARDDLRRHLDQSPFSEVGWRVRAVNGAHLASPWSSVRHQGPSSGGVDG